MKKLAKFVLKLLVVLFLLLCVGVVWVARQQAIATVSPERRPITETPADYGIEQWETVSYVSADNLTLYAYFIPPDPASNGATIIFVHGITGTRQSLLAQASMLAEQGYGALLIELRGHGESDGEVVTFGIEEINDVRAAIDFLATRPEVNSDQLGILGQSLGCMITLPAAAAFPELNVVVGESCMADFRTNIEDGVRNLVGLPPFPFAPLIIFFGSQHTGVDVSEVRPITAIDDLAPRPVMLLHGSADTLFRVDNAEKLFAAAGEPKQLHIIEGVGHSPFYESAEAEINDHLTRFFSQYLPNQ